MQLFGTSALANSPLAHAEARAQAQAQAAANGGTNGTTGTGSSSSSNSTTNPTASLTSESTFLQLLVAQIKNQDPLNPTDSIQFVGQLVQYSELEQLIGINQGVGTLTGAVAPTSGTSNTSNTDAANNTNNTKNNGTSSL
jgi:flagellar basal-body rod modification protein FlgD